MAAYVWPASAPVHQDMKAMDALNNGMKNLVVPGMPMKYFFAIQRTIYLMCTSMPIIPLIVFMLQVLPIAAVLLLYASILATEASLYKAIKTYPILLLPSPAGME